MSFISKYLTHSRFLFNCVLNFNKVYKRISLHICKNVHTNRPHRNMIFADIARLDLLLLNTKLIMNKPIKHLQIVWASTRTQYTGSEASITEKKKHI